MKSIVIMIVIMKNKVTNFLNDKYDPFNFKLSGWSEHMSVEVDSYDDVLEELYEKYMKSGHLIQEPLKQELLKNDFVQIDEYKVIGIPRTDMLFEFCKNKQIV